MRVFSAGNFLEDAESHRPAPDVPIPEHAKWVWKHEYDLLRAEIAWLEEFIAFLESNQSKKG